MTQKIHEYDKMYEYEINELPYIEFEDHAYEHYYL